MLRVVAFNIYGYGGRLATLGLTRKYQIWMKVRAFYKHSSLFRSDNDDIKKLFGLWSLVDCAWNNGVLDNLLVPCY